MNQTERLDVLRRLGRALIDRTGNGAPSARRRLAARFGLVRDLPSHLVSRRTFRSSTEAGVLTAVIDRADEPGPNGSHWRCTIDLHGPRDGSLAHRVSVDSHWLGGDETWPDDPDAVADAFARLGRLLHWGDEVEGAKAVNPALVALSEEPTSLTTSADLLKIAFGAAADPEGGVVDASAPSAVAAMSLSYRGTTRRPSDELVALLRTTMPRSLVAVVTEDAIEIDPLCMRFEIGTDPMDSMRIFAKASRALGPGARILELE